MNSRALNTDWKRKLVLITTVTLLGACAGTPEQSGEQTAAGATQASSAATTASSDTTAGSATETAATGATTETTAQVAEKPTEPPKFVDSCKDEAYIKYEQQARASIAKGLQATKDQRFGVGFRDIKEHNRWSETHNQLFKKVASACEGLSTCTKNNAKNKDKACLTQAKAFQAWQNLGKRFTDNVKSVETTQPPELCSMTPAAGDPSWCFESLANNIENTCETTECKEAAACWRSIAYLDSAISQAKQSCGFVHQDLKNCRGYTEASMRRKNKFTQCVDMKAKLTTEILPAL